MQHLAVTEFHRDDLVAPNRLFSDTPTLQLPVLFSLSLMLTFCHICSAHRRNVYLVDWLLKIFHFFRFLLL